MSKQAQAQAQAQDTGNTGNTKNSPIDAAHFFETGQERAVSTPASTPASTFNTRIAEAASTATDADNAAFASNAEQQAAMIRAVAAKAKPTPHTDSIAMNEELANLGEELGQFKAYDSQLTIAAITGTRVVKCLYQKSPKTGEKAQANSYVRIPTKHLTEEHIVSRIAELTPYALEWLQGLEDTAIREYHKKGGLSLFPASLSLDKLIEQLEASSEGARLNKAKIEAWFEATLQDELEERFAVKLGLNENSNEQELAKLELIIGAYKTKFVSLASGKSYLIPADCIAMIAVIAASDSAADSLLGARFTARLTKMSTAPDELLMSI